MKGKITEGWAVQMTDLRNGRTWFRYNSYGTPWKRRTEPANIVNRLKKHSNLSGELFHIQMFYTPEDV